MINEPIKISFLGEASALKLQNSSGDKKARIQILGLGESNSQYSIFVNSTKIEANQPQLNWLDKKRNLVILSVQDSTGNEGFIKVNASSLRKRFHIEKKIFNDFSRKNSGNVTHLIKPKLPSSEKKLEKSDSSDILKKAHQLRKNPIENFTISNNWKHSISNVEASSRLGWCSIINGENCGLSGQILYTHQNSKDHGTNLTKAFKHVLHANDVLFNWANYYKETYKLNDNPSFDQSKLKDLSEEEKNKIFTIEEHWGERYYIVHDVEKYKALLGSPDQLKGEYISCYYAADAEELRLRLGVEKADFDEYRKNHNGDMTGLINACKTSSKDAQPEYHGPINSEGKREGVGKLFYPNGRIFEGNFVDGKKEGVGKEYFQTLKLFSSPRSYHRELIYKGNYKNDQFHGEGEWRDKNEKKIGTFKDGQFVKGKTIPNK